MVKNENLTFIDQKSGDAILGTLEGPCADFVNGTRNNRKYSEELWERVFSDPIVKEMLNAGGIPGELDHPADRSETDSTKIAIIMKEAPEKRGNNLWAKFYILNTPCGKIAYTLAKAGFKLGISSRGEGDVTEDYNSGEEVVDPETYTFNAFDLVLLPAVKAARLNLITESYDKKKFNYKKALKEELEKSKPEDREIMLEALKNLDIDIDSKPAGVEDMKSGDFAAVDDGAAMIRDFQKSLKRNKELQAQVKALQEKLSVCYAKETRLTEELEKAKASNDAAIRRSINLTEQLNYYKEQAGRSEKVIERQSDRIDRLTEELDTASKTQKKLRESMQSDSGELKRLNEQLKREKAASDRNVARLQEDLANVKQDFVLRENAYNRKVSQLGAQADRFKKMAGTAVNKYIEVKSAAIGIEPAEVRSRLRENYSFNDIDRTCEELRDFSLSIHSLPFQVDHGSKIKVSLTESKSREQSKTGYDDGVNDQLASMASRYLNK